MHRGSYTFIEMLVVCVIVLLITALVAPRLGGGTKRMIVENALSNLRGAFTEAAMRARASGQPLALVLDLQEDQFLVRNLQNPLDHEWHAPILPPLNGPDGKSGILPGATSYEVSKDITWTDLPAGDAENSQQITFQFFPDGEASGPELNFEIQDRKFILIIDSVLGKAPILEEEG